MCGNALGIAIHAGGIKLQQETHWVTTLHAHTGGMSGGIEGGTAGKSGQERKDVAGTGAGDTGNQSGDTAGRQIEGASNQGLSGQGGVF